MSPARARYEQVADAIRTAIVGGEYPPGQAIPAELELAKRFGLSRPSIRRAVAVLRAEGWLDVQRGRGMFVRQRRPMRRRYTPQAPRGGPYVTDTTDMRLVRVEVLATDARLAAWLEVDQGAEVIVRRRHWVVDGDVIQLFDSYLPHDLVAGSPLAGPGFVAEGTYVALARMGLRPVRATEEVAARMPTGEEAAALHLGERTPVLEVARVSRDAGGRVLEGLRVVAAADRNTLVYEDLPLDVQA